MAGILQSVTSMANTLTPKITTPQIVPAAAPEVAPVINTGITSTPTIDKAKSATVAAPQTGLVSSTTGGVTRISNSASGAKSQAVTETIPTFTPRDVTARETVAGQLNDLLNEDSPYLTSARNRAAEVANSRGLLNSSIAVGSGERAAIDAALPIATADAGMYADNAMSAQNSGYTAKLNEQNIQGNVKIAGINNAAAASRQAASDSAALARQQLTVDASMAEFRAKAANDAAANAVGQFDAAGNYIPGTGGYMFAAEATLAKINQDGQLGASTRESGNRAILDILAQSQTNAANINMQPAANMSEEARSTALANNASETAVMIDRANQLYGTNIAYTPPTFTTPEARRQAEIDSGSPLTPTELMRNSMAVQAGNAPLHAPTPGSAGAPR